MDVALGASDLRIGPFTLFPVLFRQRIRALRNAAGAAPPTYKWISGILSLGGAVLFAVILLVCAALVERAPTVAQRNALIEQAALYLFLFLLGGAVPFVSAVLFTPGDLNLLVGAPIPPVSLVALRMLDAVVVSSAQFLVIGVPVLFAIGVGLHYGPIAWLAFALLLVIFVALPSLMVCALLLILARIVGLRRVRFVVAAASVLFSVGLCLLLVSTLSAHSGNLDSLRAAAVSPAAVKAVMNPWLPSTWESRGLLSLGGARPDYLSAFGAITLLGVATALTKLLCFAFGGRVLTGEQLLEGEGGGARSDLFVSADRALRALGLPAPVRAIIGRDIRFIARDLVLLAQLGIPLILYLIPFALRMGGSGGAADDDLALDLALGTLGMIAYMETSILGLSSIGLEGRGFWLVLCSPLSAGRLIVAKWLVASGVSLLLTVPLAVLALVLHHAGAAYSGAVLGGLVLVSLTLCGLNVGLSALFPRFVFENPAHRASLAGLVWGFVLSTAYCLVMGVIGGGAAYVVQEYAEMARQVVWTAVGAAFTISVLTAVVPLVLARARLSGYAWEE